MNAAGRLLLELLRPGGPARLPDGVTATAGGLLAAARLARGHGLFLLADRGVRERADLFGAALADGAYEREARPLRLRLAALAIEQEAAERRGRSLLAGAGIATALLKGTRLCAALYGEPHLKASADVDLLVHAADVPTADAALRAAGFAREDDLPLAFWMRRLHQALYAKAGERVPVELHWGVSVPGFFAMDEAALWAGAGFDGLDARLSPAATLLHLVLHHHLHGFADLRTLVDLAWGAWRLGGAAAADGLPARLEAIGARVVADVGLCQAGRLWGPAVEVEAAALRGGRCPSLRARVLARATLPRLERDPRREPGGVLAPRLALEPAARVLWSFAKSVAPAAGDLQALAPGAPGRAAARVQYWRWRLGRRSPGAGRGGAR